MKVDIFIFINALTAWIPQSSNIEEKVFMNIIELLQLLMKDRWRHLTDPDWLGALGGLEDKNVQLSAFDGFASVIFASNVSIVINDFVNI